MERVFTLDAVLQDLEQAPYIDQPDTVQSTGQGNALQVAEPIKAGQAMLTELTTERFLVLEPVLQVLVHALYADQLETTQQVISGRPS